MQIVTSRGTVQRHADQQTIDSIVKHAASGNTATEAAEAEIVAVQNVSQVDEQPSSSAGSSTGNAVAEQPQEDVSTICPSKKRKKMEDGFAESTGSQAKFLSKTSLSSRYALDPLD